MSLTGLFFPFSTSFFSKFPVLKSFSLHQMAFSTSLYKFYPCLLSWSIYSSMVHITIRHAIISLWILSISLLCAFPPTRVPLPYPEGCLYCSFILLVSLLGFFHAFLLDGLGVFAYHTAWKNFPFRLFHWTKSYTSDMHTDWKSILSKRTMYLLHRAYFWRIFATKTSNWPPQRN